MKQPYFIIPVVALILAFGFSQCQNQATKEQEIDGNTIAQTEDAAGLDFTRAERDSMLENVRGHLADYRKNRETEIENAVAPATVFDPVPGWMDIQRTQKKISWDQISGVSRPEDDSELAFYPVPKLASLIRSGKLTSEELTRLYLKRLKQFGDTLNCVITLTEELALQQAKQADREIAAGNYRGPLHGIPYGLKDLIKVEGYKTTWGAVPFKNQQLEGSATVYNKLKEAGAVLVAKLSMGALAWGDVWFGGKTKNPWDLEQGSSGSSAGSASATSAGLVGFSLGTETYGSIVSPSTRCGVTGLRPTYGRVSRAGAMALSWTMDKIGPICRSAKGCAMVFEYIHGTDHIDRSVNDYPFNYSASREVTQLRVGYVKSLFEADYRGRKNDSLTLVQLRSMGIDLYPVSLPDHLPVASLGFILDVEAAAAFDRLTRSGRDEELTRQVKNAWPNVFRAARMIPAVEYVKANRLRTLLMDTVNRIFREYDAIVTPSFGGNQLLMTNLTGHPCVVVPNGFDEEGHPTSISFIGNLYREGSLLELASAYQEATGHEEKRPGLFAD